MHNQPCVDLTEKNIFELGRFSKSDFKKIIGPLIIEQALMLSVGMIDILMVSFAGENAVSGVSLVDAINTLLIFLLTALATGGAIIAGQFIGRKNVEQSNLVGKQLLIVTFWFSIILMAICLIFNNQLLSLLFGDVNPEVMGNARSYFYITAISFPFIALYSSSAALFRAMGNTKVPMLNSLIMNVINIFGNAIFIYVLRWGAFGTGLSTLLSRIVIAFVITYMLRNKNLAVVIRSYKFWEFDLQTIKKILKISIPASLENCVFQFGRIILTGLIATLGTDAIAANAVTGSLINIATVPGQALGLAMTTVVAQCVGAKEFKQAILYTKHLLKTSWIYMGILDMCIFILLKPILSLYHLSATTFSLSFSIMIIHIVGWVTVWPLSFALPNTFRAAGDVKYPMAISAFSMVVFRIGCSYLLVYGFGLGVYSIFIAMLTDWVFRCICFSWHWKTGKWKRYVIT